MLGLFGTLNLGARSLQVQQKAIEVAGQNLANVNNPAYARQRLLIQASPEIPSTIGPEGTGAEAVAIDQLRNGLLDQQIQGENSLTGSLQAQQNALQDAQAGLAQQINTQGTQADGTAGVNGLAEDISNLFNRFQSLATDPTSLSERQVLIANAQNLASHFNGTARELSSVRTQLNTSLQDDVSTVNQTLDELAHLNQQITTAEAGGTGKANDLRDLRQQKIESLATLVKIDLSQNPAGLLTISIDGATVLSGAQVTDPLEAYDAGGGQMLVRTRSGTALTLAGGEMEGTITARDGSLASLQASLDRLAGELVTQINSIHAAGFSLSGTTGEAFFTGTDAASISVNNTLVGNPALIQASGAAGETGNNQVVLALAQLGHQAIGTLQDQTFSQHYGATVASLGQALASINSQESNQGVVNKMLLAQRQSVSGVSLDEEMTSLMTCQKAFQASARFISTLDSMIDTVIHLQA